MPDGRVPTGQVAEPEVTVTSAQPDTAVPLTSNSTVPVAAGAPLDPDTFAVSEIELAAVAPEVGAADRVTAGAALPISMEKAWVAVCCGEPESVT